MQFEIIYSTNKDSRYLFMYVHLFYLEYFFPSMYSCKVFAGHVNTCHEINESCWSLSIGTGLWQTLQTTVVLPVSVYFKSKWLPGRSSPSLVYASWFVLAGHLVGVVVAVVIFSRLRISTLAWHAPRALFLHACLCFRYFESVFFFRIIYHHFLSSRRYIFVISTGPNVRLSKMNEEGGESRSVDGKVESEHRTAVQQVAEWEERKEAICIVLW